MDFSFDVFLLAIPSLLKGMVITAKIAALSALVGLVVGTIGGLARVSPRRALRLPALIYVTLMRATPVLVTLLFLYYGLPSAGLLLDATTVGVLALGLLGWSMSRHLRKAKDNADLGRFDPSDKPRPSAS